MTKIEDKCYVRGGFFVALYSVLLADDDVKLVKEIGWKITGESDE